MNLANIHSGNLKVINIILYEHLVFWLTFGMTAAACLFMLIFKDKKSAEENENKVDTEQRMSEIELIKDDCIYSNKVIYI